MDLVTSEHVDAYTSIRQKLTRRLLVLEELAGHDWG